MITILTADSPAHYAQARRLFQAYAESLNFNLCFQDFAAELESLPSMYGAPSGALLLAQDNISGQFVGCVGLRSLCDDIAELKRMYVVPDWRGQGIGRLLLDSSIEIAHACHYAAIRLDSLNSMASALRLYRAYGFVEIPAYRFNPLPDALYLELKLTTNRHVS